MSDSDGRCQGCTIVGLERTDRVSCERFTKLILYRDITGSNVPRNSCRLYSGSTYATQRSYYAIISSPSAWIFIANGYERVPSRHDQRRRKRKAIDDRTDPGQPIYTNRLRYSCANDD